MDNGTSNACWSDSDFSSLMDEYGRLNNCQNENGCKDNNIFDGLSYNRFCDDGHFAYACITSISIPSQLECTSIEKISPVYTYIGDTIYIYPMYYDLRPDFFIDSTIINSRRCEDENPPRPKRGRITELSQNSATRLKKRIGRMGGLQVWLDLTFSDDTMAGTVTERAEFSTRCINRMMTYIHEEYQGVYLVWRREWQARKSGKRKGELCPHFHCLLGGLDSTLYNKVESFCVSVLEKWIETTRTENPKAYLVAFHRSSDGQPSSYRKIESVKQAVKYVCKYFSKSERYDIDVVSIGRCWGYSKHCPDVPPVRVSLSYRSSCDFRVSIIRHLRLKPSDNPDKIGLFEQLNCGFATYVWGESEFIIAVLEEFL